MSTQYRKADCQSTKNVMGDKGVDPQSGPSGVSLGFKVQPEHAYLGHFKQEKFLREGHNSIFGGIRDALGGAANKLSGGMLGGGGGGSSARPRPSKKQLADPTFRAAHKVAAARADVRAAKRSGDESAIQAAKVAKQGVLGERKEALSTIRGARKALNEARSSGMGGGTIRTAQRSLKTARETAKQGFAGAVANQAAAAAARRRARSSGGGILGKINPF